MQQLRLYATSHCSLCEQALDLLLSLPLVGVELQVVDIADSEVLLHRYAERIPVLTLEGAEYDGKFEAQPLWEFLSQSPDSQLP